MAVYEMKGRWETTSLYTATSGAEEDAMKKCSWQAASDRRRRRYANVTGWRIGGRRPEADGTVVSVGSPSRVQATGRQTTVEYRRIAAGA